MAANMMGHKVCHTSYLQHFHYMTYIGCAGQIGILINYYQQPRMLPSNAGTGAKYTKSRRPVTLAYLEEFDTKSEAMKREAALKKMTHRQKEELASGWESKGQQ